jgi:hypothetical protein
VTAGDGHPQKGPLQHIPPIPFLDVFLGVVVVVALYWECGWEGVEGRTPAVKGKSQSNTKMESGNKNAFTNKNNGCGG